MHKIVLFGGTTEGRILTEFLSQNKIPAIVCVATEYGEKVLEYEPPVIVQPKRLKPDPMRKLFEEEQTEFVFDATHPYATEVSKHIKEICDEQGIEYIKMATFALFEPKWGLEHQLFHLPTGERVCCCTVQGAVFQQYG